MGGREPESAHAAAVVELEDLADEAAVVDVVYLEEERLTFLKSQLLKMFTCIFALDLFVVSK